MKKFKISSLTVKGKEKAKITAASLIAAAKLYARKISAEVCNADYNNSKSLSFSVIKNGKESRVCYLVEEIKF